MAFFVGLLLMLVLLIYSYTTVYAGGWGDLSRNIMLGLTLLAFAVYCLFFLFVHCIFGLFIRNSPTWICLSQIGLWDYMAWQWG